MPEARLAHGQLPFARVIRAGRIGAPDRPSARTTASRRADGFCDGSGGGPAPSGLDRPASARPPWAARGAAARFAEYHSRALAISASRSARSAAMSSREQLAAGTSRRRAESVVGRRLREERRQIVAQLLAGRVAILQLGRQRLQRDASSSARHARRAPRRRHELGIAHAAQELLGGVAVLGRARRLARRKQLPPGEQLPQDDARRVQIGAPVERLAARLLGRHVADLAVDDAGRGLLELQRRRRQPEVGQLAPRRCTTAARSAARRRGGPA